VGNPNWVEKLNESIVYFTEESVREFVMEGSEGLPSLNEKEKTLWVKEALDKLDSLYKLYNYEKEL